MGKHYHLLHFIEHCAASTGSAIDDEERFKLNSLKERATMTRHISHVLAHVIDEKKYQPNEFIGDGEPDKLTLEEQQQRHDTFKQVRVLFKDLREWAADKARLLGYQTLKFTRKDIERFLVKLGFTTAFPQRTGTFYAYVPKEIAEANKQSK